jgi:hypothetical protein
MCIAEMSMAALPLPPPLPRHDRGTFLKKSSRQRRGRGRFLKKSSRQRRGSGSIFFEDIEKLHEYGRILVFTNETP